MSSDRSPPSWPLKLDAQPAVSADGPPPHAGIAPDSMSAICLLCENEASNITMFPENIDFDCSDWSIAFELRPDKAERLHGLSLLRDWL